MTGKVIAELRRRGFKFVAIAFGELPEEFVSTAAPDEWHEALSDQEERNLLRSAAMLLECTDQQSDLSPKCQSARELGIPVISHGDAATGAGGIGEWSADAFADAVIELGKRV